MKKSILLCGAFFLLLSVTGCSDQQIDTSSATKNDNIKLEQKNQEPPVQNSSKLTTGTGGAASKPSSKPAANAPETLEYLEKYNGAVIHTSMGDIKVTLYNEESPLTVNNFLKLSQDKFYDNTKFHRVIKDFMIQGGDPNSKDENFADDGTGGPGYSFRDEINEHKLVKGSLAMANSGPNTNGSQFFIVTKDSTPWLDGKHTNFGQVVEGMDIVEKIQNVKTDDNDHPTENVIIKSIDLIEKKK